MSKEIAVITGRSRQIFSEEEKRRMVSEFSQSNLSLNQFAKKMGISPAALCLWRKQCQKQVGSHPIPMDLLQENECLKLENQNLKTELYKLKAYLGHKLFENDSANFDRSFQYTPGLS